jgi:SAM-dependent methyltransferase
MEASREEWFEEWFDSPFYYTLYKHRNINDAKPFLNNLIEYLDLKSSDKILDLACGRGRHAIYLNQKGLQVTGIDLSKKNIKLARQFENEKLKFFVHDMRQAFKNNEFDYVLNFFTSFGYFNTREENQQVVVSVNDSLKKGGKFLLDFLNPYTVINNLEGKEVKCIEGIEFHLSKTLREDGYIIKNIDFEHEGRDYHFREKVKAIRRTEFLEYFEQANLKLLHIFGDYQLNQYFAEKSERMIFLLEKPDK